MTDRLLGADPTAVTGGEALGLLTRGALRVAVPVALVIVVASAVLRGTAAGLTALVVALVLVGLHVGSGAVAARLSRDNPQLMPAVTMVGLLLRLGLYGAIIALVGDAPGIDVPVLAVTVITLTVAMLVVESVLVARYSKFWWQPTTTAQSRSLQTAPSGATERTEA